MTLPHSVNDRSWAAFGQDNSASENALPIFRTVGGWVKTSAQTYADGDLAAFSMDTSGRLRCILEGATFTVSGSDLEIDVSAFRGTTGVTDRQDAWVFTEGESLATVSEKWQGFGGWDETADVFRALPIATDNAAMPATAQGLPIMGEYNATPQVYGDGDAAIFQLDVNGRLITAVELNDYTDDSSEFTVATSKLLAIGGLATTDPVDAGDVGVFAMTLARELHTMSSIWDGTTKVVVETSGSKKALNVNITDGTNDMPTMDVNSRAGFVKLTDGTDDVNIHDATDLVIDDVATNDGLQTASLLYGYDNTGSAETWRGVAVDANGFVETTSVGTNDPAVVVATGAAGITASTTLSAAFKLISVTCHFSAAPTTSEDFVITLNANDGAAYDTVLFSVDPSAASSTDVVYIPDGELLFESGDEIDVTFTNTDTRTYGVRIVTQPV